MRIFPFVTTTRSAWLWLGLACLAATCGVSAAETGGRGYQIPSVPAPVQAAPQAGPPATTLQRHERPITTREFENQPLNLGGNGRRPPQEGGEREYRMPSIWPVLFGVVAICAVFAAVLYLVKKYLPNHRQLFSHPAMEVLGRTHLDPKRYVTLLRVGKRIVVVGVSPDEMRPLSEITDEEEITDIMEVARPKTEAGLTIFQRLFQRNVIDRNAEETRAIANAKAEELHERTVALRERVRAIRETEEPARHLDTVG